MEPTIIITGLQSWELQVIDNLMLLGGHDGLKIITCFTRVAAESNKSISDNQSIFRSLLSRDHELADSSDATMETLINLNIDKLEPLGFFVRNIEILVTSTLKIAYEKKVDHAIRPLAMCLSSPDEINFLRSQAAMRQNFTDSTSSGLHETR
jgi:hypothetical protein